MKQGDKGNVSTDWRRELNALQTKFNIQEIKMATQDVRLFRIKEFVMSIQSACRKVGWVLAYLSVIVATSDFTAKKLTGSAIFSINYNETFGLFQILATVLFGGLAILLLIFGYAKMSNKKLDKKKLDKVSEPGGTFSHIVRDCEGGKP